MKKALAIGRRFRYHEPIARQNAKHNGVTEMTDRTFAILTYAIGLPACLAVMGGVAAFGLYWTSVVLAA